MARIGANKASCKKYKDEGRKEKNKKRKQKRHLKRLEYFARKRNESQEDNIKKDL